MNINGLTNGLGGQNKTQDLSGDRDNTSKRPKQESSVPTDEDVHLSPQGMSIQQIEAQISQLPDIDDSTIERIQLALASNSYQIDYERLADKIINFESQMN